VGCKIHYLEFRIQGIINATKMVALEYEVQIEVNETWYITKLLIHGTAKYSETGTVLGKFFFGWETWSCSSLYLLLSLSLSLILSHGEKRMKIVLTGRLISSYHNNR